MYTDIFQKSALAKNEARIYESLLRNGELSVGEIATKAGVNRRNVYDTLNRLIEKGLVVEIFSSKENRYSAVEPTKLSDILHERLTLVDDAMPHLQDLYKKTPSEYQIYTYRGKEGWKNYMRDIIRIGEDAYFIGAKGGWFDERVKDFLPSSLKEAQRKGITFYHLFDHEMREKEDLIKKHVGKNYKFLPDGYSAPGAIDFFGNHVNIIAEATTQADTIGKLGEDIVFTVIVNKNVADTFRTWFKFMWDFCPKDK